MVFNVRAHLVLFLRTPTSCRTCIRSSTSNGITGCKVSAVWDWSESGAICLI